MYNEQENIQRKSTGSTRSFQYADVFSSKSCNCRIPTRNKAARNYNTTLISIEMSVIICLYFLLHVLLPERVPCGVCRWWLSLLEYPCYPAHLLVDHSASPRRVDGSTQVCLLPKVRADASSPPAAQLEWSGTLLRSLGVALLVGGLAGSPRRKAVDAQSPHSRERPRCVSESECGTSRGAPRSPGRLVHRRHEADANTQRHGSVCLLVS